MKRFKIEKDCLKIDCVCYCDYDGYCYREFGVDCRNKSSNFVKPTLSDVLAVFMKEADDYIESHNEENIKFIFKKVLGKYFSVV
jgi:hypothetical protein